MDLKKVSILLHCKGWSHFWNIFQNVPVFIIEMVLFIIMKAVGNLPLLASLVNPAWGSNLSFLSFPSYTFIMLRI
jgi:hypothetical protein